MANLVHACRLSSGLLQDQMDALIEHGSHASPKALRKRLEAFNKDLYTIEMRIGNLVPVEEECEPY